MINQALIEQLIYFYTIRNNILANLAQHGDAPPQRLTDLKEHIEAQMIMIIKELSNASIQ